MNGESTELDFVQVSGTVPNDDWASSPFEYCTAVHVHKVDPNFQVLRPRNGRAVLKRPHMPNAQTKGSLICERDRVVVERTTHLLCRPSPSIG